MKRTESGRAAPAPAATDATNSPGEPPREVCPDGGEGPRTADPADRRSRQSAGDLNPRERLEALVGRLPLAAGAFIGALALLVPYVLITVVTFVAADRGDAVSTAADMFFTVATFGPGERFVDGFVSVAAITSLGNVRPADYPSVEAELDAAISLLQTSPEAALLLLYVAGPWILYLGGRYLSRHYAAGETPADVAVTGATVAAGTLPVTLVLGLAFSPPNLLRTVLLFGLVLPAALGAVGGLSVYAFRRETVSTSKAAGWLGVLLGVLATFVLSPWLPFPLDLAQRASIAVMGFLAAASLDVGITPLSALIVVLVALAAVLAGYVRTSLALDAVESSADAARLGASVVLGFVGAVALLAAVAPLSTIVIGLPAGATTAFATAQPTVVDYLRILVVGGVVFPLVLGTAGGYLAARDVGADADGLG